MQYIFYFNIGKRKDRAKVDILVELGVSFESKFQDLSR